MTKGYSIPEPEAEKGKLEKLIEQFGELFEKANESAEEWHREVIEWHLVAMQRLEQIDAAKKINPRAWKLMEKKKPFVVVAVDEPYFAEVYAQIREHENREHNWNDTDELLYRNLIELNKQYR